MNVEQEKVKATFWVTQTDVDNLKEIAASRGINHNHALRQAITTDKSLMSLAAQGAEFYVKYPGETELTRLHSIDEVKIQGEDGI